MPDFELFIATDEVASAGGKGIPHPGPGVESDPEIADRVAYCDVTPICTLWGLLTGEGYRDKMEDAFEQVYEGSEDGPWVQRLPQDLVDRLCELSQEQIDQIALKWSRTEEFNEWAPEPPPSMFPWLARLFRRDRRSDRDRLVEERRKAAHANHQAARANLETLVRLARRATQSGKRLYLWSIL